MTPRDIRRARLTLDLTLSQFGALFNMSDKAAWRWEQEKPEHNTKMSEENILKLKDILLNQPY